MKVRPVVLLTALLVLAVPGLAVAAEKVFVEPGIDPAPPQVRPHEFLLSGDGTLALYGLRYRTYGGPAAEATGRGYTQGCTPDCAQGKVFRPQARVRLSHIRRCEGKLLYTKLEYAFKGPIPGGLERHATYDLRPIDDQGKPVC